MLRTAKALQKLELQARDGVLGKVNDFYFEDDRWTLRYLIIETGSWFNSRKVLISADAIAGADWEKSQLSVNLTREQVRGSPGIDTEKPVSREQQADLHAYYAWPAYWMGAGYLNGTPASVGGGALGIGMVPPMGAVPPVGAVPVEILAGRTAPDGDPHLRRGNAVAGCRIEASDGSIGHVEDFLIDDGTWDIRYIVIDTRNWLPGRKVVIFPGWIRDVDWAGSRVSVDLTRERIEAAPAYDPDKVWDAEYAVRLETHYGRPSPGLFK